MTRLILAVVAVLSLSELTPARAQFLFAPHYAYRGGYSYSYRRGFGFAVGGPQFRVGGFSGGFVTRSAFFSPLGFRPFGPFGPFGPIGFNPVGFGFGNPFWGGWGPGFGAFGFGGFVPPVVTVPVPVPVVVGGNFPNPDGVAFGGNLPPEEDRTLLPKKDYLVIAPKKITAPEVAPGEPVPIPLPLPLPKPKPKPKVPAPPMAFDPFKVPAKVKAEVAEADPKKEAARLVNLARESFAAGDYGRAGENFERAVTADPTDAMTYFLLAQAKFAAGQFAEAVTQIRKGLARDTKWPTKAFDPTKLYGERPERFVLHLFALKKALNENPTEATLEFLLGYELWFSGDKMEAEKLLRSAEKRLPAPGPIALFK
jgi:hypothetical protein